MANEDERRKRESRGHQSPKERASQRRIDRDEDKTDNPGGDEKPDRG